MHSHASTTILNLYRNLYCTKVNGYFRVEEFFSKVLLHHRDISWLGNNSEESLEYFMKSEVFVLKKERRGIFLGSFRKSFLGRNASKLRTKLDLFLIRLLISFISRVNMFLHVLDEIR